MKGRGRSRAPLFSDQALRQRASCTKTRTTKEPESTSGDEPAGGLALTPATCGAFLTRTSYVRMCPITASLALSRSVGWPAIHSAISTMMGFGHVPTGSIRSDGHTVVGGPRR